MRTLIVFVLAILFLASPVLAQQVACGPRAELLAQLAKDYGEKPVFLGTLGNGDLFELTFSHDGTWTAMESSAHSGMSCLKRGGKYGVFERLGVDGEPL